MKPYRSAGRRMYKLRVYHPDGRRRNCSLGTESLATANIITRWVQTLFDDRRWDVLDAIITGKVSLQHAYDNRGEAELKALLAALTELNIEPLVAKWHTEKSKARKGAASADRYQLQVRRLILPSKPYPASQFSRKVIDDHLRKLDVDDPTRNRHRAAFMSFAKYLVRGDFITTNVVRDIEGWSEGHGRMIYHERDMAQRIIAALPQPYAAMEALMCGAGLELQAIKHLKVRDVDLEKGTVLANATKTGWRRRLCRIVEPWTINYIRPALVDKVPAAPVFPGITSQSALRRHDVACTAAEAERGTLHDWRHTHAVLMLRAGYRPTVVAHQLGHRDTNLVWRRYGRFVVDDRDYVLDRPGLESKPEPAPPLTHPKFKENAK